MSHLCVCITKTRPQVVPAVLDAEQREMEEMRSLIDNGAFGPPGRAHARLKEGMDPTRDRGARLVFLAHFPSTSRW